MIYSTITDNERCVYAVGDNLPNCLILSMLFLSIFYGWLTIKTVFIDMVSLRHFMVYESLERMFYFI